MGVHTFDAHKNASTVVRSMVTVACRIVRSLLRGFLAWLVGQQVDIGKCGSDLLNTGHLRGMGEA